MLDLVDVCTFAFPYPGRQVARPSGQAGGIRKAKVQNITGITQN